MAKDKKIVIAGGGTGGHIFPALAIAKGLEEIGVQKQLITFFGSARTMEKDIVPKYGYKLITFKGRGLNKNEYLKNIFHLCLMFFACIKALLLFIIDRPKVVIGVGGYASLPALFAASILKIKRVVHEQNAYVGRTNMLAAKFGASAILTFDSTVNKPDKYEILGLPRMDNFESTLNLRKKYLQKIKEQKLVVISGGSLGSQAINEVTIEMIKKYNNQIDYEIIHFVGKNNFKHVAEKLENLTLEFKYSFYDFKDNINTYYAQSDCVVSRAGAGTCIDLEIIGVPCVLIPLPNAPGDHQKANAQSLILSGQGDLLEQQELNAESLFSHINKALNNSVKNNSNSFHLDARNKIANYIKENYL